MCYVAFAFVSWLVIGTALSANVDFLKAYDEKVCNNEPSCNLINEPNLTEDRRTLWKRDCMCDSECLKYGDCCADSEFYNAVNGSRTLYTCSASSRMYMLTNCPDGYADQEIVSKCLASTQPSTGDNFLIRPATNLNTHTTYGNAYCAICHDDAIDIVLWSLTARCGEAPAGSDSQNRISSTSGNTNQVSTPPKNSNPPSAESFENNNKVSTPSKNSIPVPSTPAPENIDKVTSTTKKPSLFPSISINKQGVEISALGHTFKPSLKPNFFGRNKRQATGIDYNKYRNDLNNILEYVRYDNNTKRFVSQYNGKNFVCEFSTLAPKNFNQNVHARKCVPNLISSCPANTDKETAAKCLANTAIVYNEKKKTVYKNRECAKCNNELETELSGCTPDERATGSALFSTADKGAAPPCDKPEFKSTPMCTS